MYRNVTKSCNWDYRLRARATTRHMHAHHRQQQLFPLSVIFTLFFVPYTRIFCSSVAFGSQQLLLPFPFFICSCFALSFLPQFHFSSFQQSLLTLLSLSLFGSIFFQFRLRTRICDVCVYVLGPTAWDRIALRLIQILYLVAPSKFVRPMLSHEICVNEMAAERIVQIWHKFSNLTIKRQAHGKQNNSNNNTEKKKRI